jgi:hypothetical protein
MNTPITLGVLALTITAAVSAAPPAHADPSDADQQFYSDLSWWWCGHGCDG